MGVLQVKASWVTSLSLEEARAVLSARVKPGKLLVFERGSEAQPFRGEVTGDSFRIVHRSVSSNSFAPVITGTLTAQSPTSTTVSVSCEPHVVMVALVALWSLVAAICVGLLVTTIDFEGYIIGLLTPVPAIGPLAAVAFFQLAVPSTVQTLKTFLPPDLRPPVLAA